MRLAAATVAQRWECAAKKHESAQLWRDALRANVFAADSYRDASMWAEAAECWRAAAACADRLADEADEKREQRSN